MRLFDQRSEGIVFHVSTFEWAMGCWLSQDIFLIFLSTLGFSSSSPLSMTWYCIILCLHILWTLISTNLYVPRILVYYPSLGQALLDPQWDCSKKMIFFFLFGSRKQSELHFLYFAERFDVIGQCTGFCSSMDFKLRFASRFLRNQMEHSNFSPTLCGWLPNDSTGNAPTVESYLFFLVLIACAGVDSIFGWICAH